MSWLSKHVFPKIKRLTVGRAIKAFVPGGNTIVGAYDSLKHAANVGREAVQRKAAADGISELEAAAILAQRAASSVTAADVVDRNRKAILVGAAAGAFVLLIVVLARRK